MTARRATPGPAVLDPLTLPLTGLHLIEASAGTGKTWTLATLYLRALLEPPPDGAAGQAPRDVTQVLTLTFTEAAAAELRTRIRARIVEARDVLAGAATDDGVLAAICTRVPEPARAHQRLCDALTRMDEAQIGTIHGFCARVLGDHAFGAGAAFDAETLTDEGALDREILADFWRRRCAGTDAGVMLACYPAGPPDLGRVVLPPELRRVGLRFHPPAPGAQELAEARRVLEQARDEFASGWPQAREAAVQAIVTNKALSRTKDNGYKQRFDTVLAAADAWAATPGWDVPKDLTWLGAGTLAANVQPKAAGKGLTPPDHPVFHACQRLLDADAHLTQLRELSLRHELADWWRTERARRKAARGQRGFDDLLTGLADALDGADGDALACHLARTWPLALIDEFQDTDPVQWRIFQRIYLHAGEGTGALALIGDPKQAIYAFRGADVYTYLTARRQVPPAGHATLGTNHRSTAPLVHAVNALFRLSDQPFVDVADIPFNPVQPAGRVDAAPLVVQGDDGPPLRVWWLPPGEETAKGRKPLPKEKASDAACAAVAADIARLLRQAQAGEATLAGAPLGGRDIGILVANRHQGADMQAALRRAGIASVVRLRESVYATQEAAALAVLLAAVADPTDTGAVRAALAGPLIGFTAAQLDALSADERAHGDWLEIFGRARDRIGSDGAGPALLGLLHDAGITAQLAGRDDGGRALTNLLHLCELLGETGPATPDALVRALHAGIAQPNGEADAQQLRLESDEKLVQIVTVHSAKGLEWPVVYLPFLWSGRKPQEKPPYLFHDPHTLERVADLGSQESDAARRGAQRETLAEDVRNLYVALTRASHRCVLVWGHVNQAEHSALAWLLHPAPDRAEPPWSAYGECKDDDAARRAPWQQAARSAQASGAPALGIEDLPAGDAAWVPAPAALPEGRAEPFTGRIVRDWRITSFTGLSAGRALIAPGPAHDRPDHDALDAPSAVAPLPVPTDASGGPGAPALSVAPVAPGAPAGTFDIARFPRGAAAGTCLHGLFEALDFPAAHGQPLARAVTHALRRAGYPGVWQQTLESLVADVLDTPLDAAGFTLRTLDRTRRRDELEFYFPLAPVTDGRLNAVLGTRADPRSDPGADPHSDPGAGFADVPALRFEPVRGVLKGYVDLVFEHAGRFWIADYKSNWLGQTPDAYHPRALADAMAEHRYDLQYLLYTLALHRHLRLRVPDYAYERHFGGVYYLFVRGMQPALGATRGVFFDRPEQGLIAQLEALLGAPAGQAA